MCATGLIERFEEARPRLRVVAYRMLGSVDDAEDAVQEAWLRLSRNRGKVDNVDAWLTTVVARICLNMLRARRVRHAEELPERLAFVLHDVFAVPFDEIASIVDRSPGAAPKASRPRPSAHSAGTTAARRRHRRPAARSSMRG